MIGCTFSIGANLAIDITSVNKGVVNVLGLWSATNDFGHFAKMKQLNYRLERQHEFISTKCLLKNVDCLRKPQEERKSLRKDTKNAFKSFKSRLLEDLDQK